MKKLLFFILLVAIFVALEYLELIPFTIFSLNRYVFDLTAVTNFLSSLQLGLTGLTYHYIFGGVELLVALILLPRKFLKGSLLLKLVFIISAIYLIYDGVHSLYGLVF